MNPNSNLIRCSWCGDDLLYQAYHDQEWGVPLYDDQKLFEFLLLEGAQAGLSWITVLKKRENYRKAFDEFNADKIVRYSDRKLEQLLENPGIIRNRLKIEGFRKNAMAYLAIKEQQSFSDYLWRYVEGKPIQNNFKTLKHIPANTEISDRMSKDLKKAGFTFVGTTICYAFMQATGMVNDHTTDCHRYQVCKKLG